MAARTTRRPLRGATAQKRPAGARCRRWRRRTKRRRDARDGRVVDAGIRPLRRHRGISAGGGTHAPPIHVRGHLLRRGPAGPVAALALLAKRWAQPARRRRARAASSRT